MPRSPRQPARWRRLVAAALLAGPSALSAVAAAPAHTHGVAHLDVGVEPGRLVVALDMPLDVLLGFERAPRDDAERQRADAAVAQLRNAAALFGIDAAAGCTAGPVALQAAVLGLGGPAAAPAQGEHADLEALYEFRCQDGFKAGFVEVRLFEAFPRLQRIEVQAVTRKGQLKASLRRPASRVTLAR